MADEKNNAVVPVTPQPVVPAGMQESFVSRLKNYTWMGPDGALYPPLQVEIFLQKIALGIPKSLALECSGLEEVVVDFWIEDGEKPESPYRDFRIFYRRQIAESEAKMLEAINRSGEFQFQAALQYLKLLKPDRYDQKVTKEGDDNLEPTRVIILKDGFEEP